MNWMKTLAVQYNDMRQKYASDQLMIVFDIDDTIVDIRIPLLYVLKKFDTIHKTSYFKDFQLEDVVFEEWHIQHWLPTVIDTQEEVERIVNFVRENMWKEETILLSHRPFRGVLEVIRWFQIQENTMVGLNTGRSESLREVTLESLNILGKKYQIEFPSELLYMNPLENTLDKDVVTYKSAGIKYFQEKGYRVIAFIDNEPANLKAVDEGINDPELMLLHANTTFGSSRRLRPRRSIIGADYRYTEIVDPETMPQKIDLVWNGVNNFEIFDAYKNSNVHWAEMDLRRHPLSQKIVLRHNRFDAPVFDDQGLISFKSLLDAMLPLERGIKVVLKENKGLLKETMDILREKQIPDDCLWFDLIFEVFDAETIKGIREQFPKAIISTRVDFLVPLLSQFPNYVQDIIAKLFQQGISQFSVSLKTYNKEVFLNNMDVWGYDVNLRDIYNFEDFLQAILMLPRSIISSVNF